MNNKYPDSWEERYNNKYYIKYNKQKEEIRAKYPEDVIGLKKGQRGWYDKEERELSLQYMKEVADLLFEPNGNYQKYVWDSMPDHKKVIMERLASGGVYSFSI